MDNFAPQDVRHDSALRHILGDECLGFTFPSVTHDDIPLSHSNGGPQLRRKKDGGSFLNIIPPSMITSCLTNDPLPAGKHVWIMSPEQGNVVVGHGKSGVG